jgi:hypothetical protein
VAWIVEPLRGIRRIRVTREEIRRRRTAPRLTVVVPADSVEVDSTPNDSGLDGAFRSLENQAAYALSQADVAAQQLLDQQPDPARHGAGWRFQDDGEPSPRWPAPGMRLCIPTGAWTTPDRVRAGVHRWRPSVMVLITSVKLRTAVGQGPQVWSVAASAP